MERLANLSQSNIIADFSGMRGDKRQVYQVICKTFKKQSALKNSTMR